MDERDERYADGMTRRRWLGVAAGVSAGAGVLPAACAPGGARSAPASSASGEGWPAELTWIAWSAGSQWLTPTYEAVAGGFAERHPNSRLVVAPAGGPFLEKIKTLVAAGTPPDVVDTHQTQVRDLGPAGLVVDLAPFLKRAPYPKDYVGWEPYAWRAKQYGVPWAIQSTALFYNKALFDAAGVTYPTAAWTWDDFVAAAQRLVQPGADPSTTVWGAGDQGGQNYQWQDAVMTAFGGGLLGQDHRQVTATSPASLEALTFRAGWGTRLRITPAQPGGISGQFGTGRVAMATSGSWYVASLLRNEQASLTVAGVPWDVAPLPRGPKRRAGLAHELGIGVPNGVRSPDASWAAVRYLTTPEALRPFAEIGRIVPPQKSLWPHAVPADGPPANFKRAFLDVWGEMQVEPPFVPNQAEATAIWREEMDPVWSGQRAVAEGAAAYAGRMEQFLARLRTEGLL